MHGHNLLTPVKMPIPSDSASHRLVDEMWTPAPTDSMMVLVTIHGKSVSTMDLYGMFPPDQITSRNITDIFECSFHLGQSAQGLLVDGCLPLWNQICAIGCVPENLLHNLRLSKTKRCKGHDLEHMARGRSHCSQPQSTH